MTKEEKKLLLIDLCARLLYGVKGKLYLFNSEKHTKEVEIKGCLNTERVFITEDEHDFPIDWFKPYLRPMSSMTNEECFEYNGLCNEAADFDWEIISYKIYDWLNAHHFDYRGLIKKGLAIEATKEMYV